MHYTKTESIPSILILSSPPLPASVQALRASVWALLTNVTAGRSASGSFAKLGLDGSWLKTWGGCCQLMLDGSLEKYSGTWPKQGMMLAGECMEPQTSELRTNASDCALWPTVTINGNNNRKGVSKKAGDGLATAVHNWPTPKAGDASSGRTARPSNRPIEKSTFLQTQVYLAERNMWATPVARDGHGATGLKNQPCLCNQVNERNWPTPTASDCNGSTSGNRDCSLRNEVRGSGGQLNPDWVETLMGYPAGWTDAKKAKSFDLFRKRDIWEVFSQLWPARRGELQHEWEPPRTVSGMKGRTVRIKINGNAVVPQWAYIPLSIIAEMENEKPVSG